jgi:hypothetical protein
MRSTILLWGVLFLLIGPAPQLALAHCPTDSCVICGENRELIADANSKTDYLRWNAGTCHVWKERNRIYACMDRGQCSAHAHPLNWLCLEHTATACEDHSKAQLQAAGCEPRALSCYPDGTLFVCQATSDNCVPSFRTKNRSDNECPRGAEYYGILSYLKRLPSDWTQTTKDFFHQLGADAPTKNVGLVPLCKWKPGQAPTSVEEAPPASRAH